MLIRADSLPKGYDTARASDGKIVALPFAGVQGRLLQPPTAKTGQKDYQSVNAKIGAMARRKNQEEKLALEDDPQQEPPGVVDFMIAIFYIIFGVVAMIAGLFSIYEDGDPGRR